MGLRVKEEGGSESWSVMGQIGVSFPPRKGADFPLVLAYVNRWQTTWGSKAELSAERKALAGAASDGHVGIRSVARLLAPTQ